MRVLSYETGSSGWTDELTAFHEELSDGSHYIDVASRRHAIRALARWLPNPQGTVMDIGCSSGYMLRDLRRHFPRLSLLGADYVPGPLETLSASLPAVPLLQFDLVKCPLPSDCLDAAVLLNVFEHIKDDHAAAAQVFRILGPGGVAVVEVPAGPHLYDVYDKQLLHFRRYTLESATSLLQRAGFEIIEESHLGCFLYPAFWFVKKRNQRFLEAPPEVQRRIVSRNIVSSASSPLPGAVLRLEAALRPYVRYPFGIRCLVTARKP